MEISDEEFKQLENPSLDLESVKEEVSDKLKDCFYNIKDLFKEYSDLKKGYYTILPIWVIGTYLHNYFLTYPYIFLNATKGSGKSRTLKLSVSLSNQGQMLNSITEAVLFRTKGTLGIDEFEGITRKGGENLRELLNSAYKKGTKVKRMKKVKDQNEEKQVVEDFDVYRPIMIANIWGMEDVLGDRCLTLILEKSDRNDITNLMEIWDFDEKFIQTKKVLKEITQEKGTLVSLCRVVTSGKMYKDWNNYIKELQYNNITTQTQNNTKQHSLFKKLTKSNFNGRIMELCFPLIITANLISEEIVDELIVSLKEIVDEKREESFMENRDVLFLDFISQLPPTHSEELTTLNNLTIKFKQFVNEPDDEDKWINTKWVGRALKRLSLIKQKKRNANGRLVVLDIEKAQEKIRMFK
jgi:hypothetical protein